MRERVSEGEREGGGEGGREGEREIVKISPVPRPSLLPHNNSSNGLFDPPGKGHTWSYCM